MAVKDKSAWILIIFILSGLVVGGLLGQLASNVEWLNWMSYGREFGIGQTGNPVVLDLSVLKLAFSVVIDINIASIIGMTLAIIIYRKFV